MNIFYVNGLVVLIPVVIHACVALYCGSVQPENAVVFGVCIPFSIIYFVAGGTFGKGRRLP